MSGEVSRGHGLQLSLASKNTEAVVDFGGKGRQHVLEVLSREFPVVGGQWTPTVSITEDASIRVVSQYRHLGTQATHGAGRGPDLAACRSARAASHATRKQIKNQSRLSTKVRAAVTRAVVGSRLLYGAGTWHSLSATDTNAMADWRNWKAFATSNGCGSSTRRLGNSWLLRASETWSSAARALSLRSTRQIPLHRPSAATSATQCKASSTHVVRTK